MSVSVEISTAKPTEAAFKPSYGVPPVHTQFKPGVSPNPGGKPVKSRNKINARFLNDILDEWEVNGKAALRKCATKDPVSFVKVVASLQPKEFEITRALDDIPDDQLDAAVIAVRAIFAAQDSGNGAGRAHETQSVKVLQALPETG